MVGVCSNSHFPRVPAASHGRRGKLLKTAAQREGRGDRGSEEEAGTAGKGAEIHSFIRRKFHQYRKKE